MTKSMNKAAHGTIYTYTVGFFLSVILTDVAYLLVTNRSLSYKPLIAAIVGLAILQLMVQLLFFLHLDKEQKPRWNSMAFAFMTMVLVIIVFGSIWIMNNLNYNMMSGHDADQYIQNEENIHRH